MTEIRAAETTLNPPSSSSAFPSPSPPADVDDSSSETSDASEVDKKIDSIDEKVNETLNNKLSKMNNGAPDGWALVSGRGAAALATTVQRLSSKLNKLEIIVHFKQIYMTMKSYFFFPSNPFTDFISGAVDVLSFNWLFQWMSPLYDRLTIEVVFPGFETYMRVMTIIMIIGVISAAFHTYFR